MRAVKRGKVVKTSIRATAIREAELELAKAKKALKEALICGPTGSANVSLKRGARFVNNSYSQFKEEEDYYEESSKKTGSRLNEYFDPEDIEARRFIRFPALAELYTDGEDPVLDEWLDSIEDYWDDLFEKNAFVEISEFESVKLLAAKIFTLEELPADAQIAVEVGGRVYLDDLETYKREECMTGETDVAEQSTTLDEPPAGHSCFFGTVSSEEYTPYMEGWDEATSWSATITEDNPYDRGTPESKEWIRGFKACRAANR